MAITRPQVNNLVRLSQYWRACTDTYMENAEIGGRQLSVARRHLQKQ